MGPNLSWVGAGVLGSITNDINRGKDKGSLKITLLPSLLILRESPSHSCYTLWANYSKTALLRPVLNQRQKMNALLLYVKTSLLLFFSKR